MPVQPVLNTPRLHLRAFTMADAPVVQRLAGAREVADTTFLIPHPYPAGAAAAWFATHEEDAAQDRSFVWALTAADGVGDLPAGEVLGCVGLGIDRANRTGELGYWLGLPYWRRGLMSEATAAVVACGFTTLALHRIQARHMIRNPASGAVLRKCGLRLEGRLRAALWKHGVAEDVDLYARLVSDA